MFMNNNEVNQIPLVDLRNPHVQAMQQEEERRALMAADPVAYAQSEQVLPERDLRGDETLESLQTDAANGYLRYRQTELERQPLYERLVKYGAATAGAVLGAFAAVEGLATQSGVIEVGGGFVAAIGVAGFIAATNAKRQARKLARQP